MLGTFPKTKYWGQVIQPEPTFSESAKGFLFNEKIGKNIFKNVIFEKFNFEKSFKKLIFSQIILIL